MAKKRPQQGQTPAKNAGEKDKAGRRKSVPLFALSRRRRMRKVDGIPLNQTTPWLRVRGRPISRESLSPDVRGAAEVGTHLLRVGYHSAKLVIGDKKVPLTKPYRARDGLLAVSNEYRNGLVGTARGMVRVDAEIENGVRATLIEQGIVDRDDISDKSNWPDYALEYVAFIEHAPRGLR